MLASAAMAQEASKIKDLVIRGNRRVVSDVISGVMRTKIGQPYIQDNLDRDKKSIEDLGFFSAVSVRATPGEGGSYSITVDVEEFPEIKEIRITGNTALSTEEILAKVSLKAGDVFNANNVSPAITAIEDLYAARGFFARVSDFSPSKDVPGLITIAIVELKVGNVYVQGNKRTRDWVMKRLIKTRSGESFSGEKWGKDLRRIASTGWFEPGTIRSIEDPEREFGKIDLTAEVKEANTGMFNVGLQIDPRSSLAGILRLSESNLRGTGQSVGIDYLQTTQGGGASIGLNYINPFWDSKDTSLTASLYSQIVYRFTGIFGSSASSDTEGYNERRNGGSIGLSRPVKDDFNVGLSARFESVRTNNIPTGADPNGFIRQDGDVTAISATATLDRRDLATDPSRGIFQRIEFEPGIAKIDKIGGAVTDQSLLGTHNFTKTTLEYRQYFTDQPPRGRKDPDAPRRVLAVRAKYGAVSGTIPFFEQYFAGGSNSIRGYDEDRFWGKYTLQTSVELRIPIQRSFNTVLFVDYGGAWGGFGSVNDFKQSDKFKMHVGYGVGLSFRTPLGPIRVDFGFNEDRGSRTHFLIGTSF